jgi:hypothetical protein
MSCSKWLFQYPNDIFVETGSGTGGGIQSALKYGFKEIHSIEINKQSYDYCVKLFINNNNVNLYLGDSMVILPQILSNIKAKATFLLDAHVMDVNQTHGKELCPVLEELKIIIMHSKNLGVKHSILIDDLKLFNGAVKSFNCIKVSDIKGIIDGLDPNYKFNIGKKSIWVT